MAKHHVVFGLGFGDEGKGSIVDYLSAREKPDFVVRFNGGGQAAHNVVLANGHHHTFSQYGSGTFQGAGTFLSRHMMVNPLTMLNEREALEHLHRGYPIARVDHRALITTPYHVGLNQVRETLLKHGSCGMGVGETKRWALHDVALRVGDLRQPDLGKRLLEMQKQMVESAHNLADGRLPTSASSERALRALYRDPLHVMERLLRWAETVLITDDNWLKAQVEDGKRFIFEGAQGVLLDEEHGWYPNYTWSNCTPANALELASEAGIDREEIEVTGVLRAYQTRHGAGPLPTETTLPFAERHNGNHLWQGPFRWGHFDGRLASFALSVSGRVDGLAITHLDCVSPDGFLGCIHYAGQSDTGKPNLLEAMPALFRGPSNGVRNNVNAMLPVNAPFITIESYGPTAADKRVSE